MRQEIITLMERYSDKSGLAESTISTKFGNRFAAERVRAGSASLKTAEGFKAWLINQLEEVSAPEKQKAPRNSEGATG